MGWASAGDIFDPVAEQFVAGVENGGLSEEAAHRTLVTLISKLQDGDWDTEYESLMKFSRVPWVVQAFAECGVTLDEEDS